MRPGAALVEVLPHHFCGRWPDMYFRDEFLLHIEDGPTSVGYFRVVADRRHTRPGENERRALGPPSYWARDSDLLLGFGAVADALSAVARGVPTLKSNFAERVFLMDEYEEPPHWCGAEEDSWRRSAAGLPPAGEPGSAADVAAAKDGPTGVEQGSVPEAAVAVVPEEAAIGAASTEENPSAVEGDHGVSEPASVVAS